MFRVAILAISLAWSGAARAHDAEAIRQAGALIVCANHDALPISSDAEPPGYQIEIVREMAAELGVRLRIEWIWAAYQARYTDCDMLLGVALDRKPGGFTRYMQALTDIEISLVFAGPARAVDPGQFSGRKIAVPSASLAHFKLLDLGADTRVAYRSERAILEAVAAGQLYAGVVSNMALDWYQTQPDSPPMFAISTDILDVPSRYPLTIGLRHMDALAESDMQEILQTMREDGRLQRILDRYGQTLSQQFDNPYARVSDEISEPQGVTVRRDIIQDLQTRVRKHNDLK